MFQIHIYRFKIIPLSQYKLDLLYTCIMVSNVQTIPENSSTSLYILERWVYIDRGQSLKMSVFWNVFWSVPERTNKVDIKHL